MHHISVVLWASAVAGCITPDGQLPEDTETEQAATDPERSLRVAHAGFADTDLRFSEFFDAPFTLSAWFMPEFVRAGTQPILAENGSGRFQVGLGNAGTGDGTPLMYLRVGDKVATYPVPTLVKRTWHHLAVVRSNFAYPSGANSFSLYLDGVKLAPQSWANGWVTQPEIAFSTAAPVNGPPNGNVRLGRRTNSSGESVTWQYYGLVDEIAVYRSAIAATTIRLSLAAQRQIVDLSSLVAGFTFDQVVELNPELRRTTTVIEPARLLTPILGGGVFDLSSVVSPTEGVYTLPFATGEVWRVNYEFDDPGSHFGGAAFCWDFSRWDTSTTAYQFVHAITGGDVVYFKDSVDDDPTFTPDPNNPREPWGIRIQSVATEVASYLHLAPDSIEDSLCGGDCDDPLPHLGGAPIPVLRGQALGQIGPEANHLHFGLRSTGTHTSTIPMNFIGYEVCDLPTGVTVPQGGAFSACTWRYVSRGMPRAGQLIRKAF